MFNMFYNGPAKLFTLNSSLLGKYFSNDGLKKALSERVKLRSEIKHHNILILRVTADKNSMYES